MPPPEIRPLEQSASVDISEKVDPGPEVTPGVFTVTPTELAYAVPDTATTMAAPMASAFPVANRHTEFFFIGFPFPLVDAARRP